ncbi:DUF6851 domain-containing protein [uncultured Algibacter sp.]|uniref:DUF6851 domain-containing protein n=1 Tax=uncultured Algibacter sp. TaxID=298659 RepID=UPI00262144F8|nr:T9SS type A sorting domain-containing protein [uncultured Algibacter sp.]
MRSISTLFICFLFSTFLIAQKKNKTKRYDNSTFNHNHSSFIQGVKDTPGNYSVARLWNEVLLEAIRNDFARPTVHARNLFHTAVALYDSWALYDDNAKPYLIGNTLNGINNVLNPFSTTEDKKEAQLATLSYAAYRVLSERFKNSPGAEESLQEFDLLMDELGYDINFSSVDYSSGSPEALGNYIAQTILDYGKEDQSNEASLYNNRYYIPVNPPLRLTVESTDTEIVDPNRWQPLSFRTFIDQSGNEITASIPAFLGAEWGSVFPFSLSQEDKTVLEREQTAYDVYLDPGAPPQLDVTEASNLNEIYKWNFSLVSIWSSQLDPKDGVMWDISPRSIGNIDIASIPESFADYDQFYNLLEGGDISKGHEMNPITGNPYDIQMVPRADYARVLAEFWADGPDSETPPGHWFTILNYVSDHPLFKKKFNGNGEVLDSLEWDVKSYFILGGAMHDAAIAAWSIKGWYDYVRPISAIRYMAELGQSTNEGLPNFHVGGIPLIDGFIEQIKEGDPLSGIDNENVGKIKLYAWKGHDFITSAETDVAGVGWILASKWWPYQRPSFVTPPFAGYVSGHSTFSRAAAEVMTLITGDEFFPGGMGEFVAKKDEFLVFEKGPSMDVTLQWATYRDASDQTSLSRVWGGIHPPADDLPGRIIGEKIGVDAYNFALPYFSKESVSDASINIFPNPVINQEVFIKTSEVINVVEIFDLNGRFIKKTIPEKDAFNEKYRIEFSQNLRSGVYILKVDNVSKLIIIKN